MICILRSASKFSGQERWRLKEARRSLPETSISLFMSYNPQQQAGTARRACAPHGRRRWLGASVSAALP
eukprot:16894-Eustigmatos_ZCMA.PRE.1